MKKVLLTVVALSMLLFATTAHANLIANGDFSDGLNGWTVETPGAVKVEGGAAILGYEENLGTINSVISQSFCIAPGIESLYISFKLTFTGEDSNVLQNDTAEVVFSILQRREILWWEWEEWQDNAIYTWTSSSGYTSMDFKTKLDLPTDYSSTNPNGEIKFAIWDGTNASLGTTMAVSNVYVGPTAQTPIPGAVWLMGSGIAGLVALRRRQAA